MANVASSTEISLSSSVILSARFPWITPAGWFYSLKQHGGVSTGASAKREKVFLVDGGYFDNSGVITALRIIEEIKAGVRDMKPSPKLQIHLVVLTTAGFSEPSSATGDYFIPVETLLSTRYARGRIAIEQAEQLLAEKETKGEAITSPLEKMELQGYGYPLPLGWRLSPITRLLILGENGDASRCAKSKGANQPSFNSADCFKSQIIEALQK
jgi:hypothetical protein